PVIGSFIFHVIESFAMRFIYWQLIMGAFIIAIVILMPGGIAQILRAFVESIRHSGRIGG
ncbi:MAG: hypothetical protein QW095_01595, partial [Nitrososphaerota archaeon]